ncbi:MAG TPA: DHHW family protein [Bacillota bacterium]|nr:DHHW family protein [Bacillota bacterium]
MKITMNKTFFYVVFPLWIIILLYNFFTPNLEFSQNENRYLAQIPEFTVSTLLNGTYMAKLDEHVNDQFVFRDTWISLQSDLEYALGKRESNGVFIGKNTLLGKLEEVNPDNIENNLQGMLDFFATVHKPCAVMLVPSAAEIEPDRLPLFAQSWPQEPIIQQIYQAAGEITGISLSDTLHQHADDYIYYRTDHHWTTYGAYLAYLEYCRALGLAPAEYKAEAVSHDFNGTLYSKSGVRFIEPDTMEAFQSNAVAGCSIVSDGAPVFYDSVYFKEYLDVKDQYSYFLGQNQPIVTLYGNQATGKKLLMFKDSYAHCLAPMLLQHYDEIVLVDLRYINAEISDLINIGEFDQVLFLYSIDTFASSNNLAKLQK